MCPIDVPFRVTEALRHHHPRLLDGGALILELGCGVGLSGLVAAAALQAKAVVLTDLKVVIDKITQPNVVLNTVEKKKTKHGGGVRMIQNSQVRAEALRWGDTQDEQAVATILESLAGQQQQQATIKRKSRKKKGVANAPRIPQSSSAGDRRRGTPDLVLIGDVAYQHEPGAPSHFDALVSTLLRFVDDEHTLVWFGTRIRMPASVDLLQMLLVHFESVVEPAVTADEIEPNAFANVKHNMSVHFLRKKKNVDGFATVPDNA